jgi:hypothetical protein
MESLIVDAVFRFARECQIAAGHFIPPTDSLHVLAATWKALMTIPPVIPEPSVARQVFHAVVQLASTRLKPNAILRTCHYPTPRYQPVITELSSY